MAAEATEMVSMDTLIKDFEDAAKKAAGLQVANQSRLELYGLYKQATVGDCASSEPSRFKVTEHAKWAAWKNLTGMTEANAKHSYIELATRLDSSRHGEPSATTEKEHVLNVALEKDPESPNMTRLVVHEDTLESDRPPVMVANVELPKTEKPVEIDLQPSVEANQASALTPILNTAAIASRDSPVPTWAVFLLGVLFLCLLDDNISLGNMILNGMGVSLLTTFLISMQIK